METPNAEPAAVLPSRYFDGQGELRGLMRSFDWSSTTLGPPARWPLSLLSAANVILASGSPMYLAWGPEYLQIYNDAFRPFLGVRRHPQALGRGAPETFADGWEQLGPLFARVMESGETVERTGHPMAGTGSRPDPGGGGAHHFSPLHDDSGAVRGVLLACGATSAKVSQPLPDPQAGLGRFNEQLRLLTRAARQVRTDRDLGALLRVVRSTARSLLDADGVTVVLREGDLCHYVEEEAISPLWKGRRFPMDDCISGWVMKHKTPACIADIALDPRIPLELYRPTFVKSLAMFPMSLGEPLGAIGCYWARSHDLTSQERQLMTLLADLTARSIDSIRVDTELEARLLARERAETALVDSEGRLRSLMDNGFALVFFKDLEGRYLDVNRRFEEAVGLSRGEILGRADGDIFPAHQAKAFRENDATVMRSGAACQFEEAADCSGGERVCLVSKFPLRDGDGHPYALCGIAIDISDRKRAETALRYSNGMLQSIFDAAPVAVLVFNLKGRVTNWSAGAERMFGWTEREALGHPCPAVPADQCADFRAMIRRVARSGPESLVRVRQRKDGESIQARLSPAPLRDAGGKVHGVMIIVEDITEKTRADEALRASESRLAQLSRKLLVAQELERRRIARELHDQLGQFLVLLQINLRAAGDLPDPREVGHALGESIAMVESLHEQVRNLCLDLHPLLLDDLGLVPALRWHVVRLAQSSGFDLHFTGEDSIGRYPEAIETTCFRVAQEALTNVLRHSRAEKAGVSLSRDVAGLILRITDNGAGFDMAAARRDATEGRSMGLLSMEERIKLAGGHLLIESSPGRGTVICATFPARGAAARRPSSSATTTPLPGT